MKQNVEPLLSAIVINYNGVRWLPRLLESLLPQLDSYVAEVLFVDNASHDDSVAFVREHYPEVTIIQLTTNRGYATGVNAGLAHARGEWLLVLNTDLLFLPGAIAALLTSAQVRPRLGLAGPLLLDETGYPTCSYGHEPTEQALVARMVMARDLEVRPQEAGPAVQPVPYIVGACLLVRRAALDAVGPMDEGFFMYFEDVDWSRRFRQADWEVDLLRKARVIHSGGGTTSQSLAEPIVWFYISLEYFACKHYGRWRAWILRTIAIVTHVAGMMVRWLQSYMPGTIQQQGRGQHHSAALRFLIWRQRPEG